MSNLSIKLLMNPIATCFTHDRSQHLISLQIRNARSGLRSSYHTGRKTQIPRWGCQDTEGSVRATGGPRGGGGGSEHQHTPSGPSTTPSRSLGAVQFRVTLSYHSGNATSSHVTCRRTLLCSVADEAIRTHGGTMEDDLTQMMAAQLQAMGETVAETPAAPDSPTTPPVPDEVSAATQGQTDETPTEPEVHAETETQSHEPEPEPDQGPQLPPEIQAQIEEAQRLKQFMAFQQQQQQVAQTREQIQARLRKTFSELIDVEDESKGVQMLEGLLREFVTPMQQYMAQREHELRMNYEYTLEQFVKEAQNELTQFAKPGIAREYVQRYGLPEALVEPLSQVSDAEQIPVLAEQFKRYFDSLQPQAVQHAAAQQAQQIRQNNTFAMNPGAGPVPNNLDEIKELRADDPITLQLLGAATGMTRPPQ